MKNLNRIALGVAMLCGAGAWAAAPSGPVFASLITDKGLRAKESERYVQIYVKSSVTTDTVFFQFGEGASIDTLPVTKANSLVNIKKTGLSGGNIPVKIWAPQTVWFLNINNADATSFTAGTCGTSVREFRCENDSLNNMDFLKDMKALEYFVCANNRRVKEVTLTTPNLQRLQLGKMPALQKITVAGPEIYEFKVDMPRITSLDFSNCPKLKIFNVSNATELKDVKLGACAVLEDATFGGCTSLQALAFENMPALKKLQLYDCTKLSQVKTTNLPALTQLNLRDNALTQLSISGFPKLTQVNISGNHYSTLEIDNPSITSLTLDKCNLDSVDLTKLNILRSLYLRNGNVRAVGLNASAMTNTLTTMQLLNSRFTLGSLPARPKKMNATLNYYAPQAQPQLPKVVKKGTVVDLSAWAVGHTLDGTVPSVFKWETIFEEVLQEGVDYTCENGKFIFKHEIEDSVRCFITNPEFPSFALLTDSKGNVTDNRIITNYLVVDNTGYVAGINNDSDLMVSNPSSLTIKIISSDNGTEATVYSADGRLVARRSVNGETEMKVPAPGLYIVRAGGKAVKLQVR